MYIYIYIYAYTYNTPSRRPPPALDPAWAGGALAGLRTNMMLECEPESKTMLCLTVFWGAAKRSLKSARGLIAWVPRHMR